MTIIDTGKTHSEATKIERTVAERKDRDNRSNIGKSDKNREGARDKVQGNIDRAKTITAGREGRDQDNNVRDTESNIR